MSKMRYFISDLHGEYELFIALLEKIDFSESDELYICGDIIDKGEASVKLLKYVFSKPNIFPIMGNHEHAFLQYYRSLMSDSPNDFDAVLGKLRKYFPDDGETLDWETVDCIESLPYYIEGDDFLCVHAGITLSDDGTLRLSDPAEVADEIFIFDRTFKNSEVRHTSPKCVFFGHTPTSYLCGRPKILAYLRKNKPSPYELQDFFKVHLDTGSYLNGVLGCFRAEDCQTFYVTRKP